MPLQTTRSFCGLLAVSALLALSTGAAQAKSTAQKECAEKYQAAKAANTLNGLSYNQFRKQCSAEAKEEKAGTPPPAPTPAATPVAPAPAPVVPTAAPAAPPPVAPTTTAAPARPPVSPASTASGGTAVYPTAISSSFANEKPGKARMQTCLAQYHANKATNGNGGMKWIEKGGGYYSECNKRLKG